MSDHHVQELMYCEQTRQCFVLKHYQCLLTIFMCSTDHISSYNVNPIEKFKGAILHMKRLKIDCNICSAHEKYVTTLEKVKNFISIEMNAYSSLSMQ